MKRSLLIFLHLIAGAFCFAQGDYKASFFGCKSDGVTNNTSSIQFAIDHISKNGGGKLNFYVGRYLTGGLELKSNVTIELHEGAVLVASPNINDFQLHDNERALLYGNNLKNVNITGKGVIEADPKQYFKITNQLRIGNKLSSDYLKETPALLTLKDCENVKIEGILFQKAPEYVQKYINCKNISLDNLNLIDNIIENGGLIVFENSKAISLKNIYIETNGNAIVKDENTEITTVQNCRTSEGKPIL